ncbi:MAG: NTP transferase domain-containing protein [Clostridiales bacterium]|nr:NTP transferase domain-containing protein [Clostridiales bacterium]
MIKAVIMAGGEGKRLRPLTCDQPKPMARLCGRPVMTYLLDLLGEHDIREAAVTLRYLPSAISEYFGERYAGEQGEVALSFFEEDQPLGTAGSVKNAASSGFAGEKDTLLVISGDALTDVDLTAAVRHHQEKKAAATIVVTHVDDPREYGLVAFGGDGRVTGFVEKPGWAQAATDLANTGIYLLSPEALRHIPEGTEFDFAKDLFPLLLEKGLPVCAYVTDRYWCDIGDLNSYVACQRDILEGRVRTVRKAEGGVYTEEALPSGAFELIPPVYIGRNVHIGTAASVGPFAVLDDGCHIGNSARVKGSVLLPAAYVGDRASLSGALLCHGASVRRGSSLFEGAAVGFDSVVGENATVRPGVKIWPEKEIPAGTAAVEHLRAGRRRPSQFDDAGLTGETGVELTPELCARFGAAVGGLARGERIAVGYSHDRAAAALTMALTSGILSTGGQVWDFGPCIEPQFDFFVNFGHLHTGVYIAGGPKACLRLVATGGLPAGRGAERAVEASLAGGDFVRAGWDSVREAVDMSGMCQLYRQELVGMAPHGLSGLCCEVRGSDYEPVRLLSSVLETLGCRLGGEALAAGGLRLHLGAGGRCLSLFDEKAGYVWPDRVAALNCLFELEDGHDVALPCDAPVCLEALAEQHGRQIRRYLTCPAGKDDQKARSLAAGQMWVRDGLMMAVRLLNRMKQERRTLTGLMERLPVFAVTSRTVDCRENPGRVLRRLADGAEGTPGEGTRIRTRAGVVFIRPTKLGRQLVLTAEAADMETAAELCGELEKKLDTLFLDIDREKK